MLLINYTRNNEKIEQWQQKYININVVNLVGMTYQEKTFLSYKLLASRKENKSYALIYTPNDRYDICDVLRQIDARIRNIVDTIEIE